MAIFKIRIYLFDLEPLNEHMTIARGYLNLRLYAM